MQNSHYISFLNVLYLLLVSNYQLQIPKHKDLENIHILNPLLISLLHYILLEIFLFFLYSLFYE